MYARTLLVAQIALLVLGSAAASPTIAQGGPPPPPTNVLYGFVTGNRTLTYATPGPDYFIPGDLVVTTNATLTIEPGVTLHFKASGDTLGGGDFPTLVELDIQGHLVADATLGDSIRFVSLGSGAGQWGQIKIESSGDATLRRVALQGAKIGIANYGQITLERSALSASDLGLYSSAIATVIKYCVFADASNGISAQSGSAVITECTMRGKGINEGVGILMGSGVSTAVADTTDPRPTNVSNYAYGVQVSGPGTVTHIISHHNGVGIYGFNSPSLVIYCTVANNTSGGIQLYANGRVFDCIVTQSGPGITVYSGNCASFGAAYVDSWSNNPNFNFPGCSTGPNLASFDPFFISPGVDYHLASGSIFKTYGPWGAEIGAYGPGPGSPTPATVTSWGRVKANYR